MNNKPDLLITITTGKQDRGSKATLAFSWGCAALAMGQSVCIYLSMDGTVWAAKGAMKTDGITTYKTDTNAIYPKVRWKAE